MQAQTDPYDQLKVQLDSLVNDYNDEEALLIAKDMNAWALQNESDTSLRYAVSLRYLGVCYYYLQELDSAKTYCRFSLEALKVQGREEHPDYANSLNKLGLVYSDMGDYKAAEPFFKQALEIRKKALGEEHPNYANYLNNLGNLYIRMGDYKVAEPFYKQSLEIFKKALGEEQPDYAMTLSNLGLLYDIMGDYKAAEPYYKKALEIYKKTFGEEHPDVAYSFISLGIFYAEMGDYKVAVPFFKEALEIYKKTLGEEHPDYAMSLANLGTLYIRMHDYKAAEPFFKQAFEIYKKTLAEEHPHVGVNFCNLGTLYLDMGDYSLAEELYKQSLEIFKKALGEEHPDYAMSLGCLGNLYIRMGDYKVAEPYYKQALEIYKKTLGEEHPDYVSNENGYTELLTLTGRETEAYEILNKNFTKKSKQIADNFKWLNDNQKEAYWKKESGFYDDLSWFASKANTKVPEAVALNYNGALITKSKLLETKIIKENYYIQVDEIREELSYRKKLLNKLESDGSDKRDLMDKLRHEADSLDKQLELSWPAYAEQKRNLLITWDKVHQNLEEGEAAIEFVCFREDEDSAYQYQALIIRKDLELPVLAPLCDESKLAELEPRIDFGEYYPLVWRPIEKHLKDIHTIYYAPVGELYNLPFHSFLAPREKEGQRYLMDKYKLHQLTSTRYLALGLKDKQKERMSPSISIMGGVNYDYLPGSSNNVRVNNNFASTRDLGSASLKVRFLPGTVKEAKAIESVLSKNRWETTYLRGGNAKEERLTEFSHKNAKGIMHIATHGYAFPEYSSMDTTINKKSIRYSYRYSNNPMVRCGLVLAGGNWALMGSDTLTKLGAPENGVLTALEVSQLNLRNTKLVVLSACETGLGQIEGSEGTFGLKRGFKLAGVEQMIVSLWSVPDKETKELMTLFYSDLVQTMDPVSSFQYAQNQMRDKYPIYPEKWAGFVLVR